MILHIVVDDKFIDMAYNMFEKTSPNNNKFMLVTKQKEFKYIKTTPITIISPLRFLSKRFAKSLLQYEFVVLHWLDDVKKQLVLNAPKNVKFVWIGWGGDYYSYVDKNLFLPITQDLIVKMPTTIVNTSLKSKIKGFIKQKFFLSGIKNTEKVINRINYFAPVLEEDYHLVAKSFFDFKPVYLDWNYGSLEDDIIRNQNWKIVGKNILLGNSATAENNHLDSFELLLDLDLDDRKIICPLSYGELDYASFVENKAKELFGDKIETLRTFMPIDEYNNIISTCSVVIMNHFRQQAVGNIIAMMYFGAKVFLNKENPVYEFFKKNGAVVFEIDRLKDGDFDVSLTDIQVKKNREILHKFWGRDNMVGKTKNLISIVKEMDA